MQFARTSFRSMVVSSKRLIAFATVFAFCGGAVPAVAQDKPADDKKEQKANGHFGWPLVVDENFAEGFAQWQPTDPIGWKLIDIDGGKAFSRFEKTSKYKPKHRSPFNIAILKDVVVSDCVLEVKLQSTVAEYGHRDVCLVFGYQNPQRFYYTHFASKMDPNANQIFIVNDAPRVKISEKTSDGVKWTDDWHKLKIVRKVDDGLIEAYFDDMETPIMIAHDKTFTWGQIGIGTFDDTANFAEVKLWGSVVKPAEP